MEGPRNPGEFDLRSYLARQDVHRELIVRYPENGMVLSHAGGNLILRAAQKSRELDERRSRRATSKIRPKSRSSINGMVLGLRHQTPEDIEEPFQQTGTLHLFAVAGLHVGIMARLLWILATVARLPRKWATLLIIPALLFYAAITGLHTSSVRAAVMSAVLLGGFLVERKVFAINSLAAAATLILCWNTNEFSPLDSNSRFPSWRRSSFYTNRLFAFFEGGCFRSISAAQSVRRATTDSKPFRLLARASRCGFVRGLDRFVAVDALVLLPGYADLAAGESRRGADRVFRPGRGVALAGGGAVFHLAFGGLQQRKLGADQNHSWRGEFLRRCPGRAFLCRAPALAERRGVGNQCA